MANTEIDSLSLEIEIKGLDDKQIANLDKLSKAVARLSKALKDANFSKLEQIKVPKGIKNIQLITQNFKESMGGSALEQIKEDVSNIGDVYEEQAEDIEGASLRIRNANEEIKQSARETNKELKKAEAEMSGKKEKTGLEKALGRLGKIFKRFKTILFIKAVRRLINAVVQAVQQGVKNLAQFDESFNQTISNIKTSTTNMTNSLTLIIRPIVEMLEPAIVNMSNVISQIANTTSRLQAQTKGLSTYTKINSNYAEDYAKSMQKANLFSFDTFNQIDTTNPMFETANVDEETNDNTKEIAEFLLEIEETLKILFELVSDVLETVGEILVSLSPILNTLMKIVNMILKPVVHLVEVILDELAPILDIVVAIIDPILDIVADVLEPICDLLDDIIDVLKPALDIVVQLFSYTTILGSSHLPAMEILLKSIVPIIQWACDVIKLFLDRISSTLVIVQDIFDVFNAMVNFDVEGLGSKLLKVFQDIAKRFITFVSTPVMVMLKFVDMIINRFVGTINDIFSKISGITEFLGWGTWKWDFQSNMAGGLQDFIDNISSKFSFANGGIVGEIWQMNEFGNPEMLYNANNGSTAVITQDQLARAFENAIYNTGILEIIQNSGNLYLDGKAVAQSQSFKNEINRTNPSLNIR